MRYPNLHNALEDEDNDRIGEILGHVRNHSETLEILKSTNAREAETLGSIDSKLGKVDDSLAGINTSLTAGVTLVGSGLKLVRLIMISLVIICSALAAVVMTGSDLQVKLPGVTIQGGDSHENE